MSKREQSALQATFFDVIFGTETPAGKWFDIVLIIVIIASVVVIMLDSVNVERCLWQSLSKAGMDFHVTVYCGIPDQNLVHAKPQRLYL